MSTTPSSLPPEEPERFDPQYGGDRTLLNTMEDDGDPITRASYIALAYGNTPPSPWLPEHEEELPDELQDWTIFEEFGGELRVKQGVNPYGGEA